MGSDIYSSIKQNIKTCFKVSRLPTSFVFILRFLEGLTTPLLTIAMAKIIDNVRDINQLNKNLIIFLTVSLLLLLAYERISMVLVAYLKTVMKVDINEKLNEQIIDHISNLEYRHIEDHDSMDIISKISRDIGEEFVLGFDSIINFMTLFIKVIGLMFIIFKYVWYIGLLIILGSIPLAFLSLREGKASYEGITESERYRRKYEYLSELLTDRANINERELFSYNNFIENIWETDYDKWYRTNYEKNKRYVFRSKLGSIFLSLISILSLFLLIIYVKKEIISIGIFISLISNIFNLVQFMSWSLSRNVSMIAYHSEFSKNIEMFLMMDTISKKESDINEEFILESIEFKDLTFKYPNTDRVILDNINMKFEKGKSYGIVGENGSGKTTLIKLLTGLYDNYTGEILINNMNLRDFDSKELSNIFSVIYQDFAKYEISLKENIVIGNLKNYSEEELNETILVSGLNSIISNLKDGLKTELGKLNKDSVGLSGGEWQRVAIARSLMNPAPVKILDEPTSAIDPIAESNLYNEFYEITKKYTSILITHRLGSTRIVNYIFVLDNGKLLEEGTHGELINMRGKYYEMYESQKSWYYE